MDRLDNPFTPGAGAPPPELAGRDAILKEAEVLFGRVRRGRPEKSLLLTGLRGVGKTVLLNEIRKLAENEKYRAIRLEAVQEEPLAALLIPELRELLFELNRVAGAGQRVRKALGVLRSFIGAIKVTLDEVTFGLDIDPETGAADSGDLEVDLPKLFVAVGEAAQDRQVPVALLIDEIQYLDRKELGALILSLHQMQQNMLPLVLVGAGLPTLPRLPDVNYFCAAATIRIVQAPFSLPS